MTLPSPAPRAYGNYEILERIAVGDTAEVFKARLRSIGGFQKNLAIKRILPHLSQDAGFTARLVEEARSAGLLSHANIVQILDLGQAEESWYIAMEYVDGPDLGRILARCREKGITLPVPHAVFTCIEVLKGLEYAHTRQVSRGGRMALLDLAHRHLCPDKVLISGQGEVKLTDFMGVSRTGHPVPGGSGRYRAPEQRIGPGDARSDLYAAGLLLYEMLTAQLPQLSGGRPLQPASRLNPDVPYPLDLVLDRALQEDPAQRYPSAAAMREALEGFFHDAGFIFAHSTLAAFLKGLFPDALSPRPLGEQETRLRQRAFELDDLPTRITARAPADLRLPPPDLLAPSGQRTQPILGEEPEQETLIEQALEVWSDVRTLPHAEAVEGTPALAQEGNAALLQPPARPPPPPRLPPLPAPDGRHLPGEHAPRAPAAAQPEGRAPAPPRGYDRPAERPAPAGSSAQRFLMLLAAMAVVGMLATLFLGFFAGTRVTSLAAPRVEIRYPKGATLTFDGQVQRGPSPVAISAAPNQRHVVKVEMPEYAPQEIALTLAPGEVRVLSFQAVPLAPAAASEPPAAP